MWSANVEIINETAELSNPLNGDYISTKRNCFDGIVK